MDKKNELLNQIRSAKGIDDYFKLCIDVYSFLAKQPLEKRSEMFAWYLKMTEEHYFSKKNKEPISKHLSERLNNYFNRYEKLIVGLIDVFSLNGYPEKLYYQKIWDGIEALLSDATKEEKGFCLYIIARDRRSPYYELPLGLKMSIERYSEIYDEIFPYIQKSIFAFHLQRCYRTEITSRIVHILGELDNEEQKAVFLANFLARWEDKAIEDSKKASNSEQTVRTPSESQSADSMNGNTEFKLISNTNTGEAVEVIAHYPYPNMTDSEYYFALVKKGGTIYLTDQGKTLEQLDKIFELGEPDVVKNLTAILDQFGVVKQGNEFVIELANWNENTNEDENEDLKKCKLILFSCVSFMLNMKIFYR